MIADEIILEHIRLDSERYEYVSNALKEIQETLKPIADTYTTTQTLGKWVMAALLGISLIVGSIWGVVQIITKQW